MRCGKAQRLLSRRIDGRLSAADAAALDLHLETCPACRLVAERLPEAWRALAQLDPAGAAPDDWAAIEAAAEASRRRWVPFWLRWQLAPAPAAAALALAGMVAVGATGGVLISRAALTPGHPDPIEARMFAETLGELPWGSPASGLTGALATRSSHEKNP
jgi:predicted anti-sigma-YlaC factor YlaD